MLLFHLRFDGCYHLEYLINALSHLGHLKDTIIPFRVLTNHRVKLYNKKFYFISHILS